MKHPINKIVTSSLIIFALVFILWGASIRPVAAAAVAQAPTASKTPVPNDIAFNKPATSSTACVISMGPESEEARKAVDGLWTVGSNSKWCSGVTDKWWQVDLGAGYNISAITVFHASKGGESTAYNTRDFQVLFSTDGVNYTVAGTVVGNTADQSVFSGTLGAARYVKLIVTNGEQPGGENVARIYEVIIDGTAIPVPTVIQPPTSTPIPTLRPLINRALNKTTTGSTPCNANETTAKAVDGSTSNLINKWCSAEATKWWQVDLGAAYPIHNIQIAHAQVSGETAAYNTADYQIMVSLDNVNWTTIVTMIGNSSSITTHVTPLTTARYVKINVITGAQPGEGNIARIYEVYVKGY